GNDPALRAKGAVTGAIRSGNRPPPALRVCAQPLQGGESGCIETAAGAASYRIELAPGRYAVTAVSPDDPAVVFAHAERIRCIRAPCPPDVALVVVVAPHATTAGIDLTAGAALPPAAG